MRRIQKVKLRPSELKAKPDRYEPHTPVKIRAPLGEWIGPMAYPMVILGMMDRLITGEILKSDRWNAQGLEGAGEMLCNWAEAYVLAAKADDRRCTVHIL